VYLEFHKKKFPGGHRYWSVTDSAADLGLKEPYDLSVIPGRIRSHAERKRPPSPSDEKFLAEIGKRDRLFGPELGS
jgi:hypothetical protein